jgi:hypothetical protein
VIEGNAPETVVERGNLLPPAQMVATAAMGKNYGRPFAVGLVKQLRAVDGCIRHCFSPVAVCADR